MPGTAEWSYRKYSIILYFINLSIYQVILEKQIFWREILEQHLLS